LSDRCIAADAAGDTDTFTSASIKLRRQKDICEDFCKAAGTFTEYERTFVAGYNKRLGARTGAITREQNRQKNLQIPLTDLDKGGIIKENSETNMPRNNSAVKYGRTKSAVDVTEDYLKAASPEKGGITYEKGYVKSKHKDEIETAEWLFDTFGGDIVLLNEVNTKNQTTPDYLWNGKCWELKGTHSVNGADKLLQHAIKQIHDNPGGVILNALTDMDIVALEQQLMRRAERSQISEFDIMLLTNGKLIKILRYKK